MTIRRSTHGIPWISGSSLSDVAFEQGRAMAEDRAWQLELDRRRGDGTVAELIGANAIEWDLFARRADLAGTAQRAFAGLSEETRAFVTSYVDGVNAAFDAGVEAPECDDLGIRPGTWVPWTPLAVFWSAHVLFGSFASKLWRYHVRTTAGEDVLGLLRYEGLLGGSNAYVVGGLRTVSGMPIIAGDPHRILEAPGVYAQVRLSCTDPDDRFDVVGFCFPGVPGIQHFGHAGEVAWAITNAAADAHDVYEESDAAVVERRSERIEVRGGDAVDVEVRRTARGPIVIDGPTPMSLRTPPDVLDDLGFEAFPRLLRARTLSDVEVAFARWVEPVNNVLTADRAGEVRHFVAGRVPVRDRAHRRGAVPGESGDGWNGWVTDLPRRVVGADHTAVTANQRASAAYGVLADDFAPPFRADSIDELLSGDGHDVDTCAAVLTDVVQVAGSALLDRIAGLADLRGPAAELRRRLLQWDRRMAADSTDAACFAAVRNDVVRRICATPILTQLAEPPPYGELFAPWFDIVHRVAVALPTILAAEEPFGLDLDDLVHEAMVAVAGGDSVTWGERHRFHALHGLEQFGLPAPALPATPLSGDTDCVMATASHPATEVCVRASVARYVWDLADRDASRWVVPLGASGVPGDPHHLDQHEPWAAGEVLPVTWEDSDG